MEPALPEGYTELMSNGVPGEYAYLWRISSNAEYYEVLLNYEKPMSDLEGYVSHYRSTDAGYGGGLQHDSLSGKTFFLLPVTPFSEWRALYLRSCAIMKIIFFSLHCNLFCWIVFI